jgi:hypothetical protein
LAFAEIVAAHPGLQRDTVALLEVVDAVFTGIGKAQAGAGFAEPDGMIHVPEGRVFRWTRAAGDFSAALQQRLGGGRTGIPVGGRFILGDEIIVAGAESRGGENEEEGETAEEVHGEGGCTKLTPDARWQVGDFSIPLSGDSSSDGFWGLTQRRGAAEPQAHGRKSGSHAETRRCREKERGAETLTARRLSDPRFKSGFCRVAVRRRGEEENGRRLRFRRRSR